MKKFQVLLMLVFIIATRLADSPVHALENESTSQAMLPHSLLVDSFSFSHLELTVNIETIGVVVNGMNLPMTADLFYRQPGEALWRTGHPLIRIDNGRLAGSLFELSPATSYNIKVISGNTEITGLATTQSVELQFNPSIILHVNDDASAGGDGSAAFPFKTIQDGVNHAGPGTQILVSDGIYREAVTFPLSGAASNWIQVKAEGGGAVLDGAETLSGNIWMPYESNPQVWFTKIGASIGYLARDQNRFYMYDDLAGLLTGVGHENSPMTEGWFFDVNTGTLYIRSLDNPAYHTWQIPRLNHAFDVNSRDWIWIEGFETRFYGVGTDGCGVCAKNASHIVIRKNRIHNLQLGIFINWTGGDNQGNDTRIEYNEIYDPPVNQWPWKAVKGSSMEGTAIVVRGHIGAIVRNNNIHQIFNGIYTGSSSALDNPSVAFDVDVYNNYIYQIGDDGLEPEGACVNHRFRNNTVDSALVGISLAPITLGPTWVMRSLFVNYRGKDIKWDKNSDGIILIYHNTSWTNVKDIDSTKVVNPVLNTILRNNIFQAGSYSFEETLPGSLGNSWNNNNWYPSLRPNGLNFKWGNTSYDSLAKMCAATGLECKSSEGLPSLRSPAAGDFRLLPSSLNIDRGASIPGINDIFSGSAPDVGALEYVIDPPPTTTSITRSSMNPTNAAAVNFTVIFSEAVTGVDLLPPFSDFALFGQGVSGVFILNVVQVSPTTYSVIVNTGSGTGNIRLDLIDDDSIVDLGSTPLGGAGIGNGSFSSGEIYGIDRTPPSVTSIVLVEPNFTSLDVVHFIVNFSKDVSGVDLADFALFNTGGIQNAAILDVTGSGSIYTITVMTGTGDGSIRLDITDNDSVIDASTNPLGGAGLNNGIFNTGGSFTIDKTPPVVVGIYRADPNPSSAESVRFSVMFSESVTGVDVNDFSLVSGEKFTSISISSINGSGNMYTVIAITGDGNTTLDLDLIDNDSILDAFGHPIGGPGMGNGGFTVGESYTINKFAYNILSESFSSKGSNDGWILESGEESNKGGSKDTNSITFNLGDDVKDRQYRAILHFVTKDLPDSAVINQAILMIKKQDVVGINPFSTHGNILIDIRYGVFGSFGTLSLGAMPTSNFQAAPSRSIIGVIQNNPVGDWYWSLLDNAAHPYISLTGVTQFRLLFQVGDNDDQGNDFLKFFSGDFKETGDRPQLLVKYYIPK